MFAWQFAKAQQSADLGGWTRFVSMQNHYNLIYREEEPEMIPLCIDQGVGMIPWSPLARRFLTGTRKETPEADRTPREKSDRYAREMYYQEQDSLIVKRVVEVANDRGASSAQVTLSWLFGRPRVTAPILGTTRVEHLEQAIEALDLELSEEETGRLESDYRPKPVLGHQ